MFALLARGAVFLLLATTLRGGEVTDRPESSSTVATRVYSVALAAGSGVSLITNERNSRAFVERVETGSAAAEAGLGVSDELLYVDDLMIVGRAGLALDQLQTAVQREPTSKRVWTLRRPLRRMQAAAAAMTRQSAWMSELRASGGVSNVFSAGFEEGRGLAVAREVQAGELLVWVPESMAFKVDGRNGSQAPTPDESGAVLSLAKQLLDALDRVDGHGALRAYHLSSLPFPPANIVWFSEFAIRVALKVLGSPPVMYTTHICQALHWPSAVCSDVFKLSN